MDDNSLMPFLAAYSNGNGTVRKFDKQAFSIFDTRRPSPLLEVVGRTGEREIPVTKQA